MMTGSDIESDIELEGFDRFLMFLSADMLVPYWHLLIEDEFSVSDRMMIQTSARMAVQDFMGNESIFWNIDFSQERMMCTRQLFAKGLESVSHAAQQRLYVMMSLYCSDEHERTNVVFCISWLHRLVNEPEFRVTTKLADSQVELIEACLETNGDRLVDLHEIELQWLQSETAWDRRLRELTPDVPEYVFLNLAEAYGAGTELPVFLQNVSRLLGRSELATFTRELNQAIAQSFPEGSELEIPVALRY